MRIFLDLSTKLEQGVHHAHVEIIENGRCLAFVFWRVRERESLRPFRLWMKQWELKKLIERNWIFIVSSWVYGYHERADLREVLGQISARFSIRERTVLVS